MSVAYKKNGTEIPITSAIMGGEVKANPVLDGTEVALEGIKIDKTKYKIIGGDASEVAYDNTTSGMTADNVQDAIDEVFQSASNGKVLIADAITGKGIETSADDTFETMATNISQISSEILDSVSVFNTSTNNNRTYNITRDGYINICGYFFNTNASVYGNVEMFLNGTLISELNVQKWLYLQGETIFKLENYQVRSGDVITFRINNSSSGTSNIRVLYYLLTLS